jgi:MFS family permease
MTTRTKVPATELFRIPNFGVLWLAQVASRFGDPVTLIALAYVSYIETRSALVTAMAVVMVTVPNALFGFVGGAIADAIGHRRAMIWCDLARFILVGLVPIAIGLGLPLAIPYILVFGAASCGAVFNPAKLALLPRIVGSTELSRANALTYSSDRAVEVVGAFAAGLLVAAIGTAAFYVDALTFLLSAVLLSRIRIDEGRRVIIVRSVTNGATEGLRYLWRHTVLRANTALSLVCQLSVPVVSSLAPSLIFQRFAAGNTEVGASQFGIAEGAIAAGAVISGVFIAPRLIRFPKGKVLLAGFATYGLFLVALAMASSFELAVIVFAILGVVNVVFYVPNVTLSQELTPPDLRARVFGSRIALLNLSWLPIIVLSGALADAVGVSLLIAIAGAVTLVSALIGAFIPIVRDVA